MLVEAEQLRDYFELVSSIYVPDDASEKSLVDWLINDWRLFRHPTIDRETAQILLVAVLDNGPLAEMKCRPADEYAQESAASWESLRTELMQRNRFFPRSDFDMPRLSDLLRDLMVEGRVEPEEWFRARI